LKEYEILFDTGSYRNLVAKINRRVKEGCQDIAIGGLGSPAGILGAYILMEREVIRHTEK
jgi:hypothetical protein